MEIKLVFSEKIDALESTLPDEFVLTGNEGKKKKEDSYLSKLKSIANVETAKLESKLLERVSTLEATISSTDVKDVTNLKKSISDMRYVASKVRSCGNYATFLATEIKVFSKGQNNNRYITGLSFCNRVTCPKCASHHSRKRMQSLKPVLKQVKEDNHYQLALVTLTLRHETRETFKSVAKAIKTINKGMMDCSWWRSKVPGFITGLEASYTTEIHVHIHMLVALDKSTDTNEFSDKIASYWKKKSKKIDRSCDYSKMSGNWFKPIQPETLEQVVQYFTSYKRNSSQLSTNNSVDKITSKQKQNLWDLPAEIYTEIYLNSKHLRWFSIAGIFKAKTKNKTSNNVAANQELGSLIKEIPADLFNFLKPEDKYGIRNNVANKKLTDDQCVTKIDSILDRYEEQYISHYHYAV